MKRMIIAPNGWECRLSECPPGAFIFEGHLCFKSEYTVDDNNVEAYNEGGEFFWGGTDTHSERHNLIVQPVKAVWVDDGEGGE